MRYVLNINYEYDEFLNMSINGNTININLYMDPNTPLETVLSQESTTKLLKDYLDLCNIADESEEEIKLIESLLSQNTNIMSIVDTIFLDPEEETPEFIEKNPILKKKKICLTGTYRINHEDLNIVKSIFKNNKEIYLKLDGNDDLVTISEYEKTVNAIDEIVNKIKKYNLSPLEQVMYAYDLVRDRVYKEEDKNENPTESRDITSVLLGDKIVCLGYAIIFDKVLENLGINSSIYKLVNYSKKSGHARDIAYIKDDKYGVDGVYYFDPTWDSKKKDSATGYLDSYKFFAKTKEDMDCYKHNYTDMLLLGYTKDFPKQFKQHYEKYGIEKIPQEMINLVNILSRLIDGKNILPIYLRKLNIIPEHLRPKIDIDNIFACLERYNNLFFDGEINVETLIQVLYNVRKIEYYEEPTKYSFDIELFEKAIYNSNWMSEMTSEEKLLYAIFGKKQLPHSISKDKVSEYVEDYSSKTNLDRDIERIKVTRALKEILNSKKTQESENKRRI